MAAKRATASTRTSSASRQTEAAELILEREERRRKQARRRAKRRGRKRRQAEREAIKQLHKSVEVIKWCIVSICTVWVISFVIGILILVRVNGEVAKIQGQVDRIRRVIDNPFSVAGSRLGAEVDVKIREFLGMPSEGPSE